MTLIMSEMHQPVEETAEEVIADFESRFPNRTAKPGLIRSNRAIFRKIAGVAIFGGTALATLSGCAPIKETSGTTTIQKSPDRDYHPSVETSGPATIEAQIEQSSIDTMQEKARIKAGLDHLEEQCQSDLDGLFSNCNRTKP